MPLPWSWLPPVPLASCTEGPTSKRPRCVAETALELAGDSHVILADVSQPENWAPLVEDAWNWRGGVDIWVNNAGADVLTGDAAQWSFEEKLARLWQVDVQGTIGLSRLIGPLMRERGHGTIINIGWDQAAGAWLARAARCSPPSKGP